MIGYLSIITCQIDSLVNSQSVEHHYSRFVKHKLKWLYRGLGNDPANFHEVRDAEEHWTREIWQGRVLSHAKWFIGRSVSIFNIKLTDSTSCMQG